MVAFYEAYSSIQFIEYQEKLNLNEFVLPMAAKIENIEVEQSDIRAPSSQIMQFQTAQLPILLNMTTLTNHFEILNCSFTGVYNV